MDGILDTVSTSSESAVAATEMLTPWHAGARVFPVATGEAHAIHAYFNTCPESPDGRLVLFYRSTLADGGSGELCVSERASGAVRVVARVHAVEDAHRAACQQWIAEGRMVAFHDLRAGRWLVLVVDLASGVERVLAKDRLLGFAAPRGHHLPLYGRHWNPGPHRDVDMVDVRDGTITTALTCAEVLAGHEAWAAAEFGSAPLSLFFPVVSPDGTRAFCKLAAGSGGDDFASPTASHRAGMLVVDLAARRTLRRLEQWGHPSWTPDSAGIFEKGNVRFDLATGEAHRSEVGAPSDHPSLGPDGSWYVTDGKVLPRDGAQPDEWGIFVGSTSAPGYTIVHRFCQRGGATSWRRPHPHPVPTADGRRIYFNRNDGPWTRLHVAELSAP
jgi:hypothetical protein